MTKLHVIPVCVIVLTTLLFIQPFVLYGASITIMDGGCASPMDSGLEHTIDNGTVKRICFDPDARSMIINIEATDDGSFSLEIPRSLLDYKDIECNDKPFIILVNGEEQDHEEINENLSRQITVPFSQQEIEIEILADSITPSGDWLKFKNYVDECSTKSEIYLLTCDDDTFEVPYEIVNGTVSGIESKSNFALTLMINAMDDGSIDIDVSRELVFLRSLNGNDDSFFVLINGEENHDFIETTESTSEFRSLSIPFPQGDLKLEILGGGSIEDEISRECTISNKMEFIPPPHKQVANGASLNEVICKEGLELIFKSTDGSPACVKPTTANKLIQYGWANA